MKPVKLKLSGLQSYREVQEIDFRTLTETGLFGIFGPTGSGKSSILDAITLAMYGKVERAVNGTQGIMNQAEDALYVSFSFELQSEKGIQQYRVERRFKRTGEVSISNTVSRFVAVTDEGEEVLADKLAEVNRAVEEMIGLKMDDFTRAVVLPQGKFAEFLSLKGAERRQMLQRLFHLEKYGDQLSIKLSRKVKENDSSLKALEAEQQGLGLASKEALEEAERNLREAVLQAVAMRKKLEEMSSAAEGMAKVREQLLERSKYREQLNEMLQQQAQIAELEKQLDLSAKAAGLIPILEELSKTQAESAKRQEAAEAARVLLERCEQAALECTHKEEQAAKVLAEEEPQLLIRLEQLEQARELERETDTLSKSQEMLQEQREAEEALYNKTYQAYLKEQDLHHRGLQRRKDLQDSLASCEVKSQERKELSEAVSRKHKLDTAMDKLNESRSQGSAADLKLKNAAEELNQAASEELKLAEGQELLVSQLRSFEQELLFSSQRLNQDLEQLVIYEERLRGELKENELRYLSARLAEELQDGTPCSVCGSVHHPNPQTLLHEPDAAREEDLAQLRAISAELGELRLGLRQQLHELRGLLAQQDPGAASSAAAQNTPQAEAAPAAETAAAVHAAALAAVREYESRTRTYQEAADRFASSLAQLRAEAAQQETRAASVRQRKLLAQAAYDACASQHTEAAARTEVLAAECETIRADWTRELPGILPEEAMSRYESLQERDAQAEEIKARLDKSVIFLEEKAAAITELQQQLSTIDKRRAQLETEWRGKIELLREKEARLRSLVGDERAEALLRVSASRLTDIRSAAKSAKTALQEAEMKKQDAVKQAVMSRQAADSLQDQLKDVIARYDSELSRSPFTEEREVRAAYLTPDITAKSEHTVQEFREQEKELTLRLKDLDQKLQGALLTEEDWQSMTEQLRSIKAQDEEAMRAKARAERDLEDITRRHTRWMELEGERSELEQYGEQLSKLQSVFRGNTFVEYIAEEQLMQVSRDASARLRYLTKQRYALEVDSGGGFVIVDDANGGVKRPVSTLSGGETFLTSLSLALALSAQIQLRGQYPLQFFFLDEGFGTLDSELLDTVITSLEKLHNNHLAVGVISHVPELRARLARKLIVTPAEDAGSGSKVAMEQL
ncbi:AAA family ATPase [Neobacillus mesonae]|nr:AAA family ATPase [Neobacillus mesonae]